MFRDQAVLAANKLMFPSCWEVSSELVWCSYPGSDCMGKGITRKLLTCAAYRCPMQATSC